MKKVEAYAPAVDGTRIWWARNAAAEGLAGPTMVLCDGIGCAGFVWKYLAPELAREHPVLHWNYRGHGRSEAPLDRERVTLRDCVDDLFAVLDSAKVEEAVVYGHSMGVQVALEAHRRDRQRVRGLVLICGSYGRPLDTFHDGRMLGRGFPVLNATVQRFPRLSNWIARTFIPTELAYQLGRNFELNPTMVRRDDFFPYLSDLAAVDFDLFCRMLGSCAEHDAWEHLPRVDVPTLIVAGERDTFTPMWLSVRMHAAIPDSEFLCVPGGSHAAPVEAPELVSLRVEKFLQQRFSRARDERPRPARGGEGLKVVER